MMNPKERFLCSIEHNKVDRFPLDVGGPVSGISMIAYRNYLKRYGMLPPYALRCCDQIQQLVCLPEKQLITWHVDTRHIGIPLKRRESNENFFVDAFGIKYKRIYSKTFDTTLYFEMIDYPLKGKVTRQVINNHKWPEIDNKVPDIIKEKTITYFKDNYAIILDPPSGGILETTIWLMGMEDFLKEFYPKLELIDEIIDNFTYSFYIPYWNFVLEELGDKITMVLLGDDYGAQDRMLISPKHWRQLIKPRLASIVKEIKKIANVKVALHSCGSIEPIIGDLIEIGIDVLNPVQPWAKDMNHLLLKEKYGSKICFHGGIDIQKVLPYGTPDDVRREVERVKNTLGRNNTGWIFATSHNILADVPPENINALFPRN